MLQIEDEIAPESTNLNGRVGEYLGMLGLARMKRVVWADTGAWGTVVQALKMGYLKQTEFMPLFWYTHNPHIPGYLNGLLEESGLSDKFGETLNDSLECLFPQPHARPLDVVRGQNGWEVKLDVASYLSREWGQAALMGAHKAALTAYWQGGVTREQQRQQLAQLHELHLEAKSTGRWTGVLAENTPTWSSGAEFIKAWPANLLP